MLTVTPIKGEGLPITGLFRVGRASLGIRLYPYEDVIFTQPAIGPDFMWGAPIHFKHTDTARDQLLLQVQLAEEPLIGERTIVGMLVSRSNDAKSLIANIINFFTGRLCDPPIPVSS